jgi:hypothetical protein
VHDPLKSVADRLAHNPLFLAAPLARYAGRHALDDAGLAERLGCPVERLTDLRLCRNPHPEPPRFWQDVERIATHFELDAERLAEVIRDGQALLHLFRPEAGGAAAPGLMMAARDEEPAPPSDPGEQP